MRSQESAPDTNAAPKLEQSFDQVPPNNQAFEQPDTQVVSKVVPDLQAFLRITQELQRHILLEPTLPANAGQDPHQVDLPSLLHSIRSSSKALLSVLSFVNELSELGKPSVNRSWEAGGEIIPAAIDHINQRVKSQQPPLSPAESRLLSVYAKAYKKQLRPPEWFVALRSTFDLSGTCGDLPGPDAYICESEKLERKAAGLCDRLDTLKNELSVLMNGKGDDKQVLAAQVKVQEYIQHLDGLLDEAGDVEPKFVGKCCQQVKIEASPRPEIVDSALSLCSNIGSIIERLAIKGSHQPSPLTVECAEIVGIPSSSGSYRLAKKIARYSLNAAPFLSDENGAQTLAVLLEAYSDLRQMLCRTYQDWVGATQDPSKRHVFGKLERALGSVFAEDRAKSREVFSALADMKDPAIEKHLSALLTARVADQSVRQGKMLSPLLAKQENIQLVGQALSCVISGTEDCASILEKALSATNLRPVCELGTRIRACIRSGDSASLSRLFDDKLQALFSDSYSSFIDKAAVLHALMLAAEDDEIRPGLKGRLKSLDLVNHLASALAKGAKEKSTEAVFIERLRARISRRFSFDLSDYWGHRELVRDWKNLLKDHLTLIANPGSWRGIAPSKVFLNGFLLYGEPGTGKTFLAVCMANELEIPLVKISREEISGALSKARAAAKRSGETEESDWDEKGLEVAFANFMQAKIAQAESDMIKNDAKAFMLLVDEMEDEFLKRDPQTSSRAELTRTNIMLRVIEDLIKKHPHAIFVGATNSIEVVDLAALRLGRFGLHLNIGMPTKEDIEDILAGSLLGLGISGYEELKKNQSYNELVETCMGMTPLAIQLAVNNVACLKRVEQRRDDLTLDDDLFLRFRKKAEVLKKLDYRTIRRMAGEAALAA